MWRRRRRRLCAWHKSTISKQFRCSQRILMLFLLFFFPFSVTFHWITLHLFLLLPDRLLLIWRIFSYPNDTNNKYYHNTCICIYEAHIIPNKKEARNRKSSLTKKKKKWWKFMPKKEREEIRMEWNGIWERKKRPVHSVTGK